MTLAVDFLNDVGTQYPIRGTHAFWSNWTDTGAGSSLDSFNQSSIVDGGTGIVTPSYTNTMANRFYVSGSTGTEALNVGFTICTQTGNTTFPLPNTQTGSTRFIMKNNSVNNSNIDSLITNLFVLGEYA